MTTGAINKAEDLESSNIIQEIHFSSVDNLVTEVSPEVLEVWQKLPEDIKFDSSFLYFRKKYEQVHNGSLHGIVQNSLSSSERETRPNEAQVNNQIYKSNHTAKKRDNFKNIIYYVKLIVLISCWIVTLVVLTMYQEKTETRYQIVVPESQVQTIPLNGGIYTSRISLSIEGSLLLDINNYAKNNLNNCYLSVWLELSKMENSTYEFFSLNRLKENISEIWTLPIKISKETDALEIHRVEKVFEIEYYREKLIESSIVLQLKTNLSLTIPLTITYDLFPINVNDGIIYGAIILVGLYVIIIFELVHRTFAAILASTISLAVLSASNQKPSMEEIISWIDIDTLLLLFSMMIIVAVIADTGVFNYLAVYAYKLSKGNVWTLITTLCFFTAIVGAFLDNITTILMTSPVTIRLCEVMRLNPAPILVAKVIFSNVGGALTPVGDPPNIIIASNKDVINAGVDYGTFTIHMTLGVIMALFVVYGQFRFIYRNLDVLRLPPSEDVQILRVKIENWIRTKKGLSSDNINEKIIKELLNDKINIMEQQLQEKVKLETCPMELYRTTLQDLKDKFKIENKVLLFKSGFCMAAAMLLFFLQSLPNFNLSMGWISFLCVLLLLILIDNENLDALMSRVEWTTLIFFAALFVLMEALTKLGLITWIGKQTELVITSVGEEYRLAVAIILILWVSSIFSAAFDNVPLTTMMIKIITNLAKNEDLKLPLQPLVYALAFGACFGGNGTLIGASANIVCAGIAEQHGYRITFMKFFKVGFPVLLSSTSCATIYLILAHVVFHSN